MKLRYKITHNQFKELINVIGIFPYGQTNVINEIDFINLKNFYVISIHQINRSEVFKQIKGDKIKAFTIDINAWAAISKLFIGSQAIISPYTLAIFDTMARQLDFKVIRIYEDYFYTDTGQNTSQNSGKSYPGLHTKGPNS